MMTPRRLSILLAAALLAGAAGCSGSGEAGPGEQAAPGEAVQCSYKLRARVDGQGEIIHHLAVAPDGKIAVTAGGTALHIWSLPEGKSVRKLQVLPEGSE